MRRFARRMWPLFRQERGPIARDDRKRSCLRGEEGAETVEFALTSMIFLMLVFGFITVCFMFFQYNTSAEAARAAARWASVRGSNCAAAGIITDGTCNATAAQIQTYAQSLPGAGAMTASVQWCSSTGITSSTPCPATTPANSNNPGNIAEVTMQFTVTSWIPFTSVFNGLSLQSTAQHVIWN